MQNSKFSSKCHVTKSSTSCFIVNITTLCWWFYKGLFRVEPGQLVVFDSTFNMSRRWLCVNFNQFNCKKKDSRNINTSNFIRYLEMLNTLLIKSAGFIITSRNIFHSFIASAISSVDDPESQWKSRCKFGTSWGWG